MRRKPANTKSKKKGSPATPAVSQRDAIYYSSHEGLGVTTAHIEKEQSRASQHQPHFMLETLATFSHSRD